MSVAGVVGEIGCDESRGDGEREAAWMALFALGFRNGVAPLSVLSEYVLEGVGSVAEAAFLGRLQGREGLSVFAAWQSCPTLLFEIGLKHADPAVRGSAEKAVMAVLGAVARLDCTAARYAELLSVMLLLGTEEDVVLAAGAIGSICNY